MDSEFGLQPNRLKKIIPYPIENRKSKIENLNMAESIERYFHFLAAPNRSRPSGKLWYPAADVYNTPDGWIVKIELAGVSAEDLEIEIEGNTLYIAGIRRDKTCSGSGVSYHQMEITYSRFEKTLQFPGMIDGAKLEHDYKDGLLFVYLKKGETEAATAATATTDKQQS
ncbi:MAG: Hsp20/alpha crystallin family protein [Acidobacteriota bacterium]|nr:Hsp20/alpha crystallin family protein [Acidobacteriota bacterium]